MTNANCRALPPSLRLVGILFVLWVAAGCAAQTPPGAEPPGAIAPVSHDAPSAASLEDHLFKPGDILDRQEALALTPTQRDAIVDDVRTTQAALVDVDAQLRAQREHLAQLLAPTHIDEAEAARVSAELIQSEGQVKTLHLALLVRIKNRLTPAQQAQLRGQRR